MSPAEASDWLARAQAALRRTSTGPTAEARGRVERCADGVVTVSGLPDLRLNELVLVNGEALGFALALDADAVVAALLDRVETIAAGAEVVALGRAVDTPVGPGLLGRVVDALGRPLDGAGPLVWSAVFQLSARRRRSPSAISSPSRCRPAY